MNIKPVLSATWAFLKPVLIIAIAIAVGAGLSFLIWGPFSARAFSDRLAYGGIGAIVVGGFTAVASLSAYRTLGTPSVFTAGSDSRIATERIGEYLRMNAKRYSFVFRMLAVGVICLVASALVDVLSR
jgi:hypothetical protein